jgi:hypothetical protein
MGKDDSKQIYKYKGKREAKVEEKNSRIKKRPGSESA